MVSTMLCPVSGGGGGSGERAGQREHGQILCGTTTFQSFGHEFIRQKSDSETCSAAPTTEKSAGGGGE